MDTFRSEPSALAEHFPWAESARRSAITAFIVMISAGLIAVVFRAADADWLALFRDPAAVYKIPIYAGFFSTLGGALLLATAAISALASRLQRDRKVLFLLVVAISTFLALDDLFMFHEAIAPRYLGVPEKAVLAVETLGLGVFVIWHLRQIGGAQRLAFLLPLSLLAMSVLMDVLLPFTHVFTLIEDTAKLGGYVAWFAYWFALASERGVPRSGGME